ncbi:MAG TPA: hypothetical protein VGM67_15950 [Gemmatimonadaceae bacterium]|jgi:predicted membrane protein
MDRSRTGTVAYAAVTMIVGVIFIWMGYFLQPRHMLSVATGVLFIIAGIFRYIRVRTS